MTLPRLRIDQVLKFAWKGLFELTLINIVVTAILIGIWPQPTTAQLWMMAAVNWPVAIISIWLVSRLLGTAKYEKASPDSDSPVYSVATESIPKTSEYIMNSTDVSSVEAVSKEGGA